MAFSITADIQVRTPNLANVAGQIRNSLSGITAPINVSINAQSLANLTRASGVVNTLTQSLNSLATAATSADKAMSLLAASASRLQNISNQFNSVNQAAASLSKNVRAAGDAAEAAGRRFLGFTVVTGAVLGLTKAFREGLSDAIEFQRELTKFTQVGVATSADLKNISSEVTRLATTYGVSSRELLQSATTLKQAGLTISQVKDSLEALAQTSLAPSFDTLAKTTEGLIAVMSQFRLTTQQGAEALGAINAVSNAYAVESRDLIEAVKRAGGSFASAGGNINEFIGAFTSVRSVTREGAESIATGLRTIFARAQRGGTVDALRELGIQLRFTREEAEALGQTNLQDQFVGGAEAIRRVSEALAQIRETDPRYAKVIEELGGYRQISRLLPLLQNVTLAQEAYSVAQGGGLSIALAADQAQTTFANSLARTKEEFLALSRSIVSSPGFAALISQLNQLTSNVIAFVNAIQPVLPILTTLATVKIAQAGASFVRGAVSGNGKGFLGFANGGPISGGIPNKDSVHAMLMPDEFVIKASSARKIGGAALNYINQKGVLPRGYAEGSESTALVLANRNIVPRAEPFLNYRGLFDALRATPLKVEVIKITTGIGPSRQLTEQPNIITASPSRKLLTDRSILEFAGSSGNVSVVGPRTPTYFHPNDLIGSSGNLSLSPNSYRVLGTPGYPRTSYGFSGISNFLPNQLIPLAGNNIYNGPYYGQTPPIQFSNSANVDELNNRNLQRLFAGNYRKNQSGGPAFNDFFRNETSLDLANSFFKSPDFVGPAKPTRLQRILSYDASSPIDKTDLLNNVGVFGPNRPNFLQRLNSFGSGIGNYFTSRPTLDDGTLGQSRLQRFSPYAGLIAAGVGNYAASSLRSSTDVNNNSFVGRIGLAGGIEGATNAGLLGGLTFGPFGAAIGVLSGAITGYTSSIKQAEEDIRKVKVDEALQGLSDTIQRFNKGQALSLSDTTGAASQLSLLRNEATTQAITRSTGFFGGVTNFQQNLQQAQRQNLAPLAPGFSQVLNRQIEEYGRNLARQPGFANLSGNDIRDKVKGEQENFLGGQGGLNREIFETLVLLRSQQDPNARQNITQQFERSLVNAAQRENLRQRGNRAGEATERDALNFTRLAQAVELSINSLQGFQQQLDSLDSLFNNQINSVKVFSRESVFQNFGSGQVGAGLEPFRGVFGNRADSLFSQASLVDRFKQVAPDLIAQVTASGDLGRESAEQRFQQLVEGRFGRNTGLGNLTTTIGANLSSSDFLTEERRRLLATNPDRFLTEAGGRSLNDNEEAVQQFEKSLRELGERISNSFTRMEQRLGRLIEAEEKRSTIQQGGERLLSQLRANINLTPSQGPLSVALENQFVARRNVGLAVNSGLAPGLANNPSAIANFLAQIQQEIPGVIEQRNNTVGGSPAFTQLTERLSFLQGSAQRLNQALENLTNTANTTAAAQRRIGEIAQDRQSRLSFGESYITSDVEGRNRILREGLLIQENARRGGGLRGFSPDQQSSIISGLGRYGNAEITVGGRRVIASEYRNQQINQALPFTNLAPDRAREEQGLITQIANSFDKAKQAQQFLVDSLRNTNEQSAKLLRDTISTENSRFLTELRTRFLEVDQRAAQTALQANAAQRGALATQTNALGFLGGFGVNTQNQATLAYLTGGQGLQQIEAFRAAKQTQTSGNDFLASRFENINFSGGFFNQSDLSSGNNREGSIRRAERLLSENRATFVSSGIENPELLLDSLSSQLDSRYNSARRNPGGAARQALAATLINATNARIQDAGNQETGIRREFNRNGGTSGLLNASLNDVSFRNITQALRDLQGIDLNSYTRNLNSVNAETARLTTNLQNINNLLGRPTTSSTPFSPLTAGSGNFVLPVPNNTISAGQTNPYAPVIIAPNPSNNPYLPQVLPSTIPQNPYINTPNAPNTNIYNGGNFVSPASFSGGAVDFTSGALPDFAGPANSLSTSFNEFTIALKPFVSALERFPSILTGSFQHKVDVNINGTELFNQLVPETKKLIVGEVKKQLQKYVNQNLPTAGIVE